MKSNFIGGLAGLIAATTAISVSANTPVVDEVFQAGKPLMMHTGPADGVIDQVKVFGSIINAESCSYDPERKLILVVNRGAEQISLPNDGSVSLLNVDGSVHTPAWIGTNRAGLVLNHPFGSSIHNGKLYLADYDGGTEPGQRTSAVIRVFEMETGAPLWELPVPEVEWFNDIAVAADGTVYATQTRSSDDRQRLYRISTDGTASLLVNGAPLGHPNGVEIDNDGNIVVVNIDDTAVLTFSSEGKLLKTEHAAQPGNDGLVIMVDGTKYISSVRNGGISRIRPGEGAELIATGIPTPASMCYDSDSNQLVVPMNTNNGLAFIKLR